MNKETMVQNIGELLEETIEDITVRASEADALEGESFSTGLLNLDAVLGGLRPGEVVCIAGTSRSGRHSLACQIGLSAAKQGASVLVDGVRYDVPIDRDSLPDKYGVETQYYELRLTMTKGAHTLAVTTSEDFNRDPDAGRLQRGVYRDITI